jgi:hypothetical protein
MAIYRKIMDVIIAYVESMAFVILFLACIWFWLSLGGCAPLKPEVKTEYITVPVAPPPEIKRPTLAIEDLKTGDGPDVVIRAYSITIKTLEGYALQLESALNAYRPKGQ